MWAYTDSEADWVSKKTVIKNAIKKFNTTLFTISITPSLILIGVVAMIIVLN
jgi:hypothetical protein